MTTIPQVARAMREILTTTAAEAGQATRFVQRTSPLSGATFSQTLVFGFLGNPQATLEALAQTAAALGVEISPQALDQRFTASAAACLHQVLLAAIARVITAEPVAIPLLERFTAVYVQDIDLQKMNWKFQAGFHEHTGVSLQAHLPNNPRGGDTRVPQDTAQSCDCQRAAPPSAARLSA